METLEKILSQVRGLRIDLSAEIVLQEEVGHWSDEPYQYKDDCGDGGRNSWTEYRNVWVIDKPKIAYPNIEKQEEARQQLQQVYDSCPWYSARYKAGRALRLHVNSQLKTWTSKLEEKLGATKKETKKIMVGSHDEFETINYQLPSCDGHAGPGSDYKYVGSVNDYEDKEFNLADKEERLKAIRDACHLFEISSSSDVKDLIRRIYESSDKGILRWGEKQDIFDEVNESGNNINTGFISQIRTEAGKALGYSPLKIWVHEHPVVATASSIAAIGAASGWGYMVYQYLSR